MHNEFIAMKRTRAALIATALGAVILVGAVVYGVIA